MDNIIIRKAVPGDEVVLAEIHTESWKAGFGDILFREELEKATDFQRVAGNYRNVLQREDSNMAIALVDEKPHCFAAWGKNRWGLGDAVGELICIHSLPDNWGKGYGSVMMRYVLDQLRQQRYESVALWVFETNNRARRVYEKHGFVLTDQKKKTWSVPELLYVKYFR